MENKINIAELLKGCPQGLKLYSPICGECRLVKIYDYLGFDVINGTDDVFNFSYDGRYNLMGECCIFPSKENRDWGTFKRSFKDGDIVATESGHWIGITEGGIKNSFISTYCILKSNGQFEAYFDEKRKWHFSRLATEEEKRKLFNVIKSHGYKWNDETKTLEKLVNPKIKVGDRVLWNYNTETLRAISKVEFSPERGYVYWINCKGRSSGRWNENELTPILNKFDITTLVPFESRVLVRNKNHYKWEGALFGRCDGNTFFTIGGADWRYCIPYEGNEYLLGTTNDCDDFYKTWEK